jgi:glycosyltransferase involved in cell wall biosynthesis
VKAPRISISTPSFNQARYIGQCIRSVQEQDYPDVEHIIFDGGSTDGTLDVLRSYEGVVRWTSEPDKGQSDAINKGFRAATGDIVGWINSDDWYARGAFGIVADYFRDHPEANFVYGNCFFTDGDGRVLRRFRTLPYKWEWLLFTGLLIPQPGFFVRRRVLEDSGLLDIAFRNVMDYEWWLRIAPRHPPHFLDRYLAYFRIHETSLSGSGRLDQIWRAEREKAQQRSQTRYTTPAAMRMAGRRASAEKLLARFGRALRECGRQSTHCAPRVVVLTERLDADGVERFNALDQRHDLETQVWAMSPAGAPGPELMAKARFPFRAMGEPVVRLAARGFENRRFAHTTSALWRSLWLERPDAVAVPASSRARRQVALYCALSGAALVPWSGTASETAEAIYRALWQGLSST